MHFDYTTVGHVTIDELLDGSRRVGGTAFYSALQAARLGLRTLILTRGRVDEIESLLAPYRHELALEILPAPHTTTLHTSGSGATRSQRVLAYAGAIDEHELGELNTRILHLAPIARESPARWRGAWRFVALTPQGLARRWSGPSEPISLHAPDPAAERVAERCNAIVISEHERPSCAALIARARSAGAIVAVTNGAAPTTLLLASNGGRGNAGDGGGVGDGVGGRGGGSCTLDVPAVARPLDDLGAGDVFAAAFFVALAYEEREPVDAAAFANAAAAVRMEGVGPDAIGGRDAIEARL